MQSHWFWVVSDTLLSWIYFNPQLFAEDYENPINFIFRIGIGGQMTDKIYYVKPSIGPREIELATEAAQIGW